MCLPQTLTLLCVHSLHFHPAMFIPALSLFIPHTLLLLPFVCAFLHYHPAMVVCIFHTHPAIVIHFLLSPCCVHSLSPPFPVCVHFLHSCPAICVCVCTGSSQKYSGFFFPFFSCRKKKAFFHKKISDITHQKVNKISMYVRVLNFYFSSLLVPSHFCK